MLVSVLMAAYNADKYIQEAVDSIINQTYSDFELIIVNDMSTDKTKDILINYKDKRIKVIDNPGPKGVSGALNAGLKECKGKYIIRMDADDICHKERFQKQIKFMEAHPDLMVSYGLLVNFNEDGDMKRQFFRFLPISTEEIKASMFFGCPICNAVSIIRADAIHKYGLN